MARRKRHGRGILAAVYGYIRAVRALGDTRLDTLKIAEALDLTVQQVERAVRELQKRKVGIKILGPNYCSRWGKVRA